MKVTESSASAVWEGGLLDGSGEVRLDSGAAPALPVTWAGRTGEHATGTTPEELIAAAQAACLSMALSNGLASDGHPPERLGVTAKCSFSAGDEGASISGMRIEVRGRVPGVDAATFERAVAEAAAECPVSKALSGVEITASSTLET